MRLYLAPLFILATAALGLPGARADFNPSIVSGDARWVVYADLNGLRQNAVGRELIAHLQAQGKHVVALPGGSLTLDVSKVLATIGSVTAYGANFAKDPKQLDGTLVVEGTPELRKMLEAVLLEVELGNSAAVTEIKDLGYSAYALNAPAKGPATGPATGQADGKAAGQAQAVRCVVVAFPPEGMVIVTQSEDRVRRARDLATGKGNSLAQAGDSELGALAANAAHATIFAASMVPPANLLPQDGPHARILQMTRSASLAIGDDGPRTFAHLQLVAANDDFADKLVKILQGMTAMLSLTQSDDQKLTDFINSAKAERDGDRVSFQIAYDSTQLAAMVRQFTDQGRQGHGHMLTAQEPPPSLESTLGKRVAAWKDEAPEGGAGGAPAASWQEIPGVQLTNGAEVTLQVSGVRFNQTAPCDEVQVQPGAGAPLTFSPRMMTETRRPALPDSKRAYRLLKFAFPGEDGVYTLRVRFHPPAEGKVGFDVWVKNDSGSDDRPTASPGS